MTDQEPESTITDPAMAAVRELLENSFKYGIGVTFQPDVEGWSIGYMQVMGGGDLSSAYDLETAAKAALRPLDDLIDKLASNRAEREAQA